MCFKSSFLHLPAHPWRDPCRDIIFGQPLFVFGRVVEDALRRQDLNHWECFFPENTDRQLRAVNERLNQNTLVELRRLANRLGKTGEIL